MNLLNFGFLVLLGFAIVGSIESRIRPLLKRQEDEIGQLKETVASLDEKLDRILRKLGDD